MTEYRTCPRCGKRKTEESFPNGLAICAVCALPTMRGERCERRGSFVRVYDDAHIRQRLARLDRR